MDEFFRTLMGRKFFDGDVPRITKALERIGDELERANDLKEREKPADPKNIASEFMTKP